MFYNAFIKALFQKCWHFTFSFSCPSAWNALQSELRITDFISVQAFCSILFNHEWNCLEQSLFLNFQENIPAPFRCNYLCFLYLKCFYCIMLIVFHLINHLLWRVLLSWPDQPTDLAKILMIFFKVKRKRTCYRVIFTPSFIKVYIAGLQEMQSILKDAI